MAILAYLDESGIHGDAKACVVAGYFGKKGPWRRLETGWKATLKQFGVPLNKFHAKDAVTKRGFFNKWSRDRHDEFLKRIGETVTNCSIHPVCYGIFTDDFFKLSLNERKFVTGAFWNANEKRFTTTGCPSKPYFVPFVECLNVVNSYTPMAGRTYFFFGVDRPVGKSAKALFRYIKLGSVALNTDKLGTISFPLASETPQLQVADLFSYLSYDHMLARKSSGDWNSRPSDLLLALLRNRNSPYDTSYRTEKLMREMISVVPDLPK
jgi:hypothetical protein